MDARHLKDIKESLAIALTNLQGAVTHGLEPVDAIEVPAETVEMASLKYGREVTMMLKNRSRQLLLEVRDTMKRIESGDFGVCELCGDDIEPARLKAQPMTRMCIHCKRTLESRSRRSTPGRGCSVLPQEGEWS